MPLYGQAGAGAADALLELLARQVQEQFAREQLRLQQQRAQEDSRQFNENLGLQRERLAGEGKDRELRARGLDLEAQGLRERSNRAGAEDMERQRALVIEDENRAALDAFSTDPNLPPAVRTVIGVRRRGIPINTEDVEDPAVARQRKADDARAVAEAQYGTAAKYRDPEYEWVDRDGVPTKVRKDQPAQPGEKPYNKTPRTEMTPGQSFQATRQLRNDFVRETQSARTMQQAYGIMQQAMTAAKQGDLAAGSQGVLVTFQKILDPTSVVRESEYARSAAGQSLLSRMEGAMQRLAQGGAGVPVPELQKFVALAEAFTKKQAEFAAVTKQQIEDIAKEYGIDPANITRDYATETTQEQSTTAPRIRYDAQGRRIKQ